MKEMRGIHKFTWLVPSAARCAALAVALGITTAAQAVTKPLAVWNGDFDDATTRNGVALTAGTGNTTVAASVTIGASSTGAAFVLPTTYRYTAAVFAVSGLENAAEGDILVSLGAGSSPNLVGVYVKSVDSDTGTITLGGIANGAKWTTTDFDGSMANTSGERTFVVTYDCGNSDGSGGDGLHLYEITTGSAVVVYGSANSNGLRYATNMCDTLAIGGGKSTYGSNTSLVSFENLVLTKVAVYTSTTALPISSATAASCTIPKSAVLTASANTISALNTVAEADTANNYFVNVPTATAVLPVADATAASNLVFPYDTTITVAGATLTVTGGMPVKPGSAITSIDGSGVILYDGDTEWTSFNTACATSSIFDSSWTGTVWIKNVGRLAKDSNNINACNQNLSNMARYGNANSKVKFTNVKAYTPNVNTLDCPWTLVLEDGSGTNEYAWYNNTGWTGKTVTFKALEGDGTFYDPDNNKCRVVLQFNDASNFAGSIYARGKNIALGGAIFDTSFSESNAGTIQIPEGVSLTVATGKTWKAWYRIAVNGSVTMADTTANLIGTLSGGSTGRVCGKAPWQFGSTACNGSNSGWNGTVELASYTTTGNVAVNLSYMGNSNSKIVLKGLVDNATTSNQGPYIAPADGSTVSAEIVLDGDIEFGAANSGKTQTLNKISGSGNLTFSYTGSHTYNIKDVSGYTGTIAAKANSTVYVGLPTAPAVGARIAKVDSLNNKVSSLVSLAGSAGALTGELKTVDGTDGLYVAAKATVGETEYSTVAAALNAATASNAVVANLTGETVSVDSITAASLTVNGTGTINVTGDVTVVGAINVADAALNVTGSISATTLAMNATNIDGRNRMNAASGNMPGQTSVTAASINAQVSGSGKVTTTAGTVLLGGDSATRLVGSINAADVTISGTGTTTLYGVNAISGTVTVSAGSTVALGNPYSLGTAVRNYDAANSVITVEDGYVTAVTDLVGGSTTCTPTAASVVTVVENDDSLFGGRKVFKMDTARFQDGAKTATSHDMTTFLVWKHGGSAATWITPLNDSASSGGSSYQITTGNASTSYYKFRNGSSNYSDQDFIFSNGATGNTYASGEQCLTVCGNWMLNTNGDKYMQFGTGNSGSAIAEILIYNEDFTHDERAAIEAFLMAKWGIGSVTYAPFGTADVVLQTGSTIDLGGLTQTVQSLSGSGTVQNGTLTVTDAISLSAGEVLTLPNTAVFTLGTVAAKIVSGDSSTVTLYGSLADAIVAQNADSTGALTITASATDVVLGATEIAGVTATLADGVTAPTFVANPPYSASYNEGTIANARVASTFVWTPADASTDWASLSNWRIGEAVPVALPGSSDEVSFTTSCTVELSSTVQLAKLTIADGVRVCISADSLTAVELGDYGYGDTSTLALANIRLYPISKTSYYSLEIGGIIEIVAETSNEMRANATRVTSSNKPTHALNVSGSLTGTGTVAFRAMNSTNRATITLGGDNSDFEGTANIIGDQSLFFVWDSAASGSAKATWTVKKTDGNFSPKFGFTTGTIYFGGMDTSESTSTVTITTATGSTDGVVVEIGALNSATDVFEGSWADGKDATGKPSVRKVGSGTLTAAFTDTAAYILNDGSLILSSSDETACSTEMAGYEVVSTTDSDAGTTTYTLESNKITWTGEGGDSNWTTAGNWSGNAVPTATDFVVFEGDAEVVVPTWATSMCKYMTVNGNVTLAGAALTDNCFCLDVHGGYIDGKGTLTLRNCGLWNATTSANVVISVDVAVESTGDRAQFSRIESDNGTFTLTRDVAVGEGSKLKLKNATATEPEISLGVGGWLVVPSNSSVTTANIVVTGGAYFETTDGTDTAYVNNTASTWIGGAIGNWMDSANWSSGVYPRDDTNVTFESGDGETPASYTVYVGNDTTWAEGKREKCKNMVVNGYVTLAAKDSNNDCHLCMFGNESGKGTLTLSKCGLDNASWPYATLEIATDLFVTSAGQSQFTNRNIGFNVTGDAEFWGAFLVGGPSTFANLALKDDVTVTIYNSWTGDDQAFHQKGITVANLSVASGAQATLAYGDANAVTLDATITGTVTLEGADSTLTIPANAVTTGATFTTPLTGYTVEVNGNVYSVAVDTTVAPGGSSIGYGTLEEAQAASTSYTVVLTSAQEEQGLEAGYYTTKVVQDGETGKYVVTAVLDESVVGVDLGEEATAAVSDSAVTITVTNLKPGLCYRVVSGDSASGMTTKGAWSDYYVEGGSAPTLTAALPDSGVLYYSVEASDTK